MTTTKATLKSALWHTDNESYLGSEEISALWTLPSVREAGLQWANETGSTDYLYDHPNYGENGQVAVGVLEIAIQIAYEAARLLEDLRVDWSGTTIDDPALTDLDEFLRNPSDKGPLGSTCLDEIVDMFKRARKALREGDLDDDEFDAPDALEDMIVQVAEMAQALADAEDYVTDAITRVAEGGEV